MKMQDISAQVFGKYMCGTKYGDYWYADSDFTGGAGFGRPKWGSKPDPFHHGKDAPAYYPVPVRLLRRLFGLR